MLDVKKLVIQRGNKKIVTKAKCVLGLTEYNMRITTENNQYIHPIIKSTTRRMCPKIINKIEQIIKMSCYFVLIVLEYRPRFLYIIYKSNN